MTSGAASVDRDGSLELHLLCACRSALKVGRTVPFFPNGNGHQGKYSQIEFDRDSNPSQLIIKEKNSHVI